MGAEGTSTGGVAILAVTVDVLTMLSLGNSGPGCNNNSSIYTGGVAILAVTVDVLTMLSLGNSGPGCNNKGSLYIIYQYIHLSSFNMD